MSGHAGGQLPFTGLATVPFVVVGLVLSAVGFVLTLIRPRKQGT
ncbi:MAG TPA: hypothetical protein VEH79_00745 [Gaiellaceae bacterium]|nr:hypothetical protein [Gaiellaceae bacterium]